MKKDKRTKTIYQCANYTNMPIVELWNRLLSPKLLKFSNSQILKFSNLQIINCPKPETRNYLAVLYIPKPSIEIWLYIVLTNPTNTMAIVHTTRLNFTGKSLFIVSIGFSFLLINMAFTTIR